MKPAEPLALNHSWPLFERGQRFDLGRLDAPDVSYAEADDEWLAARGIGRWHCDLSTLRLSWSTGVYNLFDWRRDQMPERLAVLPLYQSESLSAVERLRSMRSATGAGLRSMRVCAWRVTSGGCA